MLSYSKHVLLDDDFEYMLTGTRAWNPLKGSGKTDDR
jgi:hypothetical protein